MNAEDLKITTMSKETRVLKRVTINDVEKASEMIENLMGKDAKKRKEYLLNNEIFSNIEIY